MRLVDASIPLEQERELDQLLKNHPLHHVYLTCLLNSYRDLLFACMEELDNVHVDTADLARSLAKKDYQLQHIGIPILHNLQEWKDIRKSIS